MKLAIIAIIAMFTFIAEKCESQPKPQADKEMAIQTEQMMSEAIKSTGMPNITNWTEKKLVRDLYELRDKENLLTYTYIITLQGNTVYLGKSIGFGIPASVQYSNPMRVYHDQGFDGKSATFIPQPEPNGLFMPEGLSATWVFLIDDKGNPRPVYIESEILVSPVPLSKFSK